MSGGNRDYGIYTSLSEPARLQEFITRYGSRLGPGLKTVERIVE